MPDKSDISYRLGRLFAALAHPARARIVMELGKGEMCVNTMAEILKISHSSVSQHLAILRAQRVIKEQKAGRFVFYRLVDPAMASWIATATNFGTATLETDPAACDASQTNYGTDEQTAPQVVSRAECSELNSSHS
ncbi:MAG: winged helix-turn-helix transcriptional regulator [Cyanobacteria bacterium SZAS LIN-2]|nr:winged helix-turn-helix transcriptional regulator [Cyanobacteria bacterium SZAS LIN-3]MBS1996644.1 winged helix-turn-helix transcriptional regulator [Cyanobacteria bacterium SZAS LIN-2]